MNANVKSRIELYHHFCAEHRLIRQEIEEATASVWPWFQRNHGVSFFTLDKILFSEQQPFAEYAFTLSQHQVPVKWYEGTRLIGEEKLYNSYFQATSLPKLPLRRFGSVLKWDTKIKSSFLQKNKGEVNWVLSIFESEWLPKDFNFVYSFFDNPYEPSKDSRLVKEARFLTVQNFFARDYLNLAKVEVFFPPLRFGVGETLNEFFWTPPRSFPSFIMGYFGSLLSGYIDLEFFDACLRSYKDVGLVLAGRVDKASHAKVAALIEKYSDRVLYFGNLTRSQLNSLWFYVDLLAVPYLKNRKQEGAFATKMLEAWYHGVPVMTTDEPKTTLLGHFKNLALENLQVTEPLSVATNFETTLKHFLKECDAAWQLKRFAERF